MKADQLDTALVTGGSNGIGEGIVRALLESGLEVVIADLKEPNSESHTGTNQDNIHYIRADISSSIDRLAIVNYCKKKFSRLNLLVNNAGISIKKRGDMLNGDEDSFDQLMSVNLKGPYFLTQLIAKWMISETKKDIDYCPNIINIASLTSYASSTYMAEYALSKSAVSMMTRLYADRLADYGINVYEIRPGIIETAMTRPSKEKYDKFIEDGGLPISRWGLPEDVGNAVLAISNGHLSYSTGEVINVDGGFHLRRL